MEIREFGLGTLTVDIGERDGQPCVIIEHASRVGKVGELAKEQGGVASPTAIVLLTQTSEHADKIRRALIGVDFE